ncbi:MAG: peptide deformylase [Pseudomonas fluorescens]|nr:MAG: peptide deformylase [Pseudomonas fluorescens]
MTRTARILPILLQPHTTLSAASEPAAGATTAVLETLENMLATLYRADGVGLAAPQVNVAERLVVMDLGEEAAEGKRNFTVKKPKFYINPRIIWSSEETRTKQEGCLSLPGLWADVVRPAQVTVEYIDRDGALVEETVDGLESVCIQHEIDHLDGVLFTQRLSKLRRDIAMGKWAKLRKDIVKNGAEFDVFAQEAGLIPAKEK